MIFTKTPILIRILHKIKKGNYKEYKYSASAIADFTAFQIKVVMKGTNSAHAPRIKDLRGIALAV